MGLFQWWFCFGLAQCHGVVCNLFVLVPWVHVFVMGLSNSCRPLRFSVMTLSLPTKPDLGVGQLLMLLLRSLTHIRRVRSYVKSVSVLVKNLCSVIALNCRA